MTGFDLAWQDLLPRWYPGDPFRPTEEARQYYKIKYDVVAVRGPMSILEIGVRSGYGAFIMLQASRKAKYLGIDSGLADIEEQQNYLAHAERILSPFDARIWRTHTQCLTRWPHRPDGGFFEFVHIDAGHGYAECRHDLDLAVVCSDTRWILVDDYKKGLDVKRATDEFIGRGWRAQYFDDPLAGQMLLTRQRS